MKIENNYSQYPVNNVVEASDKRNTHSRDEAAAANISIGYVKQLKMLTGDIVIKPQTGTSYASQAEAEKAYQQNLEKDGSRKFVIDSELSDMIRSDTKNILLQLKNPVLNQQEKNEIWGRFMSYADIRKLSSYLNNGTYRNADDVSDFSKLILERYAAVQADK